jgi:uncharacterized protein (DUF488 family)
MSEIKIGESFIMSDIQVEDSTINFELTILPAGEVFIEEEKKKDKEWTTEKYFENIVTTALKNYIKDAESKQATD